MLSLLYKESTNTDSTYNTFDAHGKEGSLLVGII